MSSGLILSSISPPTIPASHNRKETRSRNKGRPINKENADYLDQFQDSGFRVPLGDMSGHELMRRFVKGNGATVKANREFWLSDLRSQVEQGQTLIFDARILEHAETICISPTHIVVKEDGKGGSKKGIIIDYSYMRNANDTSVNAGTLDCFSDPMIKYYKR